MSQTDARSDIESEYEEAKKTACAYLRAVGVLGPAKGSKLKDHNRPKKIQMSIYRRRQTRILQNAILKDGREAVNLPDDPFARDAAALGHRYLRHGHDSVILETLLEKDGGHPAYREALKIVVREMRTIGGDLPERMRSWEQELQAVEGRWRSQSTRDYLIGLVIEAMATGYDIFPGFIRHRDSVRGELERDLKRVYAEAGNPPDGLFTKDVVAALNTMKGNRWRRRNDGKGLTESDLSELLEQPSTGEVHLIKQRKKVGSKNKVRTCFPSLLVTRTRITKQELSICYAVRHALVEGKQTLDYQTVVSIWKRYKNQPVL